MLWRTQDPTKNSFLKISTCTSLTGLNDNINSLFHNNKSLLRFIYDLCVLPSALEVVRQLLDTEDIVLLASCLFSKYAPETRTSSYDGDFVGWHQDLRYWGLESVREGRGVEIINMWMAVDQVMCLPKLLGACNISVKLF